MENDKSMTVAGGNQLAIIQELKIGTQDITYIGVVRHEALLITQGNDVAEALPGRRTSGSG